MLLTVLLSSGVALAITYGQPDANKHPNVGALVGTFDGETYPYCSGTLISPTVFLTAAHCAPRTTGDAVTFAKHYDPASSDPASSTDYSICRGQEACSDTNQDGYLDNFDGRFRADPNGYDIAVVVFDNPISGITPARLPSLHRFDRVAKDQKFTAVGYGEQGVTSTVYDTRNYAVSTFKSVSEDYLRLSQNVNQDNGGTCYGDSGGPNFLGEYPYPNNVPVIASITNTGDPWCKATNVTLRLDNEAARTFLSRPFLDGEGVTVP
jgi:hypothetical protein